jgi:hypothetical protein
MTERDAKDDNAAARSFVVLRTRAEAADTAETADAAT